jgi:hypothetical protein
MPPPCRHCHARLAHRPRGLCWHCWIHHRHQYPVRRQTQNTGAAEDLWRGDPDVPTPHLPGSVRKMDVLRKRAMAGLTLWHPRDRRRE